MNIKFIHIKVKKIQKFIHIKIYQHKKFISRKKNL